MNKNYYDNDYPETNRDKNMKPKQGMSYCICDRAMIGGGQKCYICGRRNGRKRLKR
jgi:hypothetical protein